MSLSLGNLNPVQRKMVFTGRGVHTTNSCCHASTNDNNSSASTEGLYYAHASSNNDHSDINTKGRACHGSSNGERANATAKGPYSNASANGERSNANAEGTCGIACANGKQGKASVSGVSSIAIAPGVEGKAMAVEDDWIVLADKDITGKINGIYTAQAGAKGEQGKIKGVPILPGNWYLFKDGQLKSEKPTYAFQI